MINKLSYKLNMIFEINDIKKINTVKNFFDDIRFFMGNSVLDGVMGKAFFDEYENPNIVFLVVRKYCFISGNVSNKKLKEIIDENFKNYYLIPSDNIARKIENIYAGNIEKSQRYSIKKNVVFDIDKLHRMSDSLNEGYKLINIDEVLAKEIQRLKFINITDNYKEDGIGVCCMYNKEIIGVASSNIFYKDGIEVNIKVKDKYRRKGIATAMCAKLIIECLKKNKKISWDAANLNSVKLAEKLGFKYDSTYNIYFFKHSEK